MATSIKTNFDGGQARPDTVTDIVGLDVYSKSGVYLGEVDDIRLDFNQQCSTGIALTNVNPEIMSVANNSGKGLVIPYNWIESVHDIIITIDVLRRLDLTE